MPLKNRLNTSRPTGNLISLVSIGLLAFALRARRRSRNVASRTAKPSVSLPVSGRSVPLVGKRVRVRGLQYQWRVTRESRGRVDLVVDLDVDEPEFLTNVSRNRLIDIETGAPLG
jgi:hypothetical protein